MTKALGEREEGDKTSLWKLSVFHLQTSSFACHVNFAQFDRVSVTDIFQSILGARIMVVSLAVPDEAPDPIDESWMDISNQDLTSIFHQCELHRLEGGARVVNWGSKQSEGADSLWCVDPEIIWTRNRPDGPWVQLTD